MFIVTVDGERVEECFDFEDARDTAAEEMNKLWGRGEDSEAECVDVSMLCSSTQKVDSGEVDDDGNTLFNYEQLITPEYAAILSENDILRNEAKSLRRKVDLVKAFMRSHRSAFKSEHQAFASDARFVESELNSEVS